MMPPPLIIGVGEILWDVLPTGRKLGGAPANFAYHASSLGGQGTVISQVGGDPDGHAILEQLRANGLPTGSIGIDPDHPTGVVNVRIGADGQPHYTISEDSAWDHIVATGAALATVRGADAVCFGILAQRSPTSRESIWQLLKATPEHALKVLDVNLRLHYFNEEVLHQSLTLANVVKLNDDELPVLADMFGLDREPKAMLEALAKKFSLQAVALTRGGHGSLLWRMGEWVEHPGLPVVLSDTVGAGDSFTAALTLGLLRSYPLVDISEHANRLASFVCGCPGATPVIPASLRHFSPSHNLVIS